MSDPPKICDPGGAGLFMPFTEAETAMPKTVRGFLYLGMLLWSFMGVNVVADYFMAAVEHITTSKRRVWNPETRRWLTKDVWNSTCANLTLLALGSSAPEILLSLIEMYSNKFYAGELGPSTIVGSAAFNLMVIIAVCVISIPSPETRSITEMSVYHVTVIFSMFAYLWLVFMCTVSSPNVIDFWEAAVTMFMMPVLVIVSFAADRGKLPMLSLEPNPDGPPPDTPMTAAGSGRSGGATKNHNPRGSKAHEHLEKRLSAAGRRVSLGQDAQDNMIRKKLEVETLPAGDDGELLRDPTGKPIANPAGILTFYTDVMEVNATEQPNTYNITVLRRNGCSGEVTVKYYTRTFGAMPGYDYEETDGMLVFGDGVDNQEIPIEIKAKGRFEPEDRFQLYLEEVAGGAQFNPNDDGGAAKNILTIRIINARADAFVARGLKDTLILLGSKMINVDSIKLGMAMWKDQILSAFRLEAEDDEETGEPGKLGPMDYVMFVLCLPFNVVFGICSPPHIWFNGWVLFVVSLCCIAMVTASICDLAGLFGCCMDLRDSTTAITVVALGTSLPDTFASQAAACKDEDADASIVNVTGSNSVNVFMGIGIPWTICALYWNGNATEEWKTRYPEQALLYPDGAFVVPSGSLGFSVTCFNGVATLALCLIRVRRLLIGGELGGPKRSKILSGVVLVCLWLLYVMLSIARSSSDGVEPVKHLIVVMAMVGVGCTVAIDLAVRAGMLKRAAAIGPDNDIQPLKQVEGGDSEPISPPKDVMVGKKFIEEDDMLDDIQVDMTGQATTMTMQPSSPPTVQNMKTLEVPTGTAESTMSNSSAGSSDTRKAAKKKGSVKKKEPGRDSDHSKGSAKKKKAPPPTED
eukprot:TRINITY_DN10099_c0_g1_i1.p1 TRINITY_DN10099_c0_g1~~TRINITY_DN10099_c0_g1_i1.p1  ORF type:complete len:862 (+),score=225.69 TRINITY_DN10099_c0_g1_i1:126-2711(+)